MAVTGYESMNIGLLAGKKIIMENDEVYRIGADGKVTCEGSPDSLGPKEYRGQFAAGISEDDFKKMGTLFEEQKKKDPNPLNTKSKVRGFITDYMAQHGQQPRSGLHLLLTLADEELLTGKKVFVYSKEIDSVEDDK